MTGVQTCALPISAFAVFLWAITFVAIVPLGLFIAVKEGLDWHSLKRIGREASE